MGQQELSKDDRLWLIGVPDQIASRVAHKVQEIKDVAYWISGASIAPMGPEAYVLSVSWYADEYDSRRELYKVTATGVTTTSWDEVDRYRRRGSAQRAYRFSQG